jgi:hypothetical protein
MANDRGRSRLFLATGSVTLAVAAATYSYFILKEAPPLSAEEAAADPGMHVEAQQPSAGAARARIRWAQSKIRQRWTACARLRQTRRHTEA